MKNLALMIFLFSSLFCFAQKEKEESVYIVLDDNSLYEINKNESSATLEIPYYVFKDDWIKEKSKSTNNNNDDVVKVEAIPNKKYYKFHSIKKPIKKSNIGKINAFSVIDVSKENKMVWKKYPYEMIFIEKINNESYIFWYMKPEFNE